jgi:hypothetical protein
MVASPFESLRLKTNKTIKLLSRGQRASLKTKKGADGPLFSSKLLSKSKLTIGTSSALHEQSLDDALHQVRLRVAEFAGWSTLRQEACPEKHQLRRRFE